MVLFCLNGVRIVGNLSLDILTLGVALIVMPISRPILRAEQAFTTSSILTQHKSCDLILLRCRTKQVLIWLVRGPYENYTFA